MDEFVELYRTWEMGDTIDLHDKFFEARAVEFATGVGKKDHFFPKRYRCSVGQRICWADFDFNTDYQ